MALPIDLDALFARVDALREEIDAMRPLEAEQAGRAMQRLRLEWTYHSNAIEGNSLTYSETRVLLLEGLTAHGKPLKDSLDIKRHREVIEYIESLIRSDEPVRLELIKEIHFRLMDEEYEVEAETPSGERVRRTMRGGDFKELPNNVLTPTGETHYYAAPIEVPGRMADLLDWLAGDEASALHPVARLAAFHHQFVEIHPFPDGNGRTARVLTNLLLMREGYVPAVLRQERRSIYYAALTAAGSGDDKPIMAFVAEELADTMELYLRALRGEPDPDAFSRRVALLRRVSETAFQANATFDDQRKALLAESFLLPLIDKTSRRVEEIRPLFGQMNHVLIVVGSSGESLFGNEARSALELGTWVSLRPHWQLEGLRANPGFGSSIFYEGRVGDRTFNLNAGKGAVWQFVADYTAGETEVNAVLEDVFDSLMDALEDAVRRAQGE